MYNQGEILFMGVQIKEFFEVYANVNYLTNAWVSWNINELFRSGLSGFLFLLILEENVYIWNCEKKSLRSDNQKII